MIGDDGEPILPYAGTSGWSGSETSRERALRDDHDGTTASRQLAAMRDLVVAGVDGLTWRELADRHEWHHGQASGVLSGLHKAGKIARLAQRRDRCEIYVLPDCVDGRETKPYRGRKPAGSPPMTDDERAAADYLRPRLRRIESSTAPAVATAISTVLAALERRAG